MKPYLGKELLLLLLLILISAASLASPYILKIIIDRIFPSKDYSLLIQILVVLACIYAFRISLSFYCNYLHTWISNHVVKDIRSELFDHVISLPISFFSKNSSGDVLHRISSDVNSVQRVLTDCLVRLINNVFSIVVIVAMLCYLNWRLFIVTSIVFPFSFLNIRMFHPKIRKNVEKIRERDSDILKFLKERLANIKLIKSYNAYDFENRGLSFVQDAYIQSTLKGSLLSSISQSISTFLVALSPILVFGWGGRFVLLGSMTLGTLVAFLQYLNRLDAPMKDTMNLYIDLLKASVSMNRIDEFLKLPIQQADSNGLINFRPKQSIVFRDVSFMFEDRPVLEDLNVTFEIGKKYALVGSSGTGKSTIVDLLLNFYSPQKGSIEIDGVSIEQIEVNSWRENISLVSQETYLFHDTISKNIGYADTFDLAEVEAAARLANIDRHISSLEFKYDSIVGDNGSNLSGGQRQRISLARALFRKFEIIVLDEGTSALDSKNEQDVIGRMFKKYHDKTFIIISHRLSTIRHADEILHLGDGKIIERGSHASLIERRGAYWELFHDQIGSQKIDAEIN